MTSPDLFWPTNFNLDIWPDNYWSKDTGGVPVVAPDFRIYKKIVAAGVWNGG